MLKKEILSIVEEKCKKCTGCSLAKTRNNVVFASGNPETAKIVLIGEAPGEMEDMSGVPFVGKAGQLLNDFLTEAGISREDDLYIINTVKCRPPENRIPNDTEKSACEQYLFAQIDIMNPKAILFCGATAFKTFFKDSKIPISKIRGNWLTVNINGKDYKSMAIFHPSYLLRNHSMEENSPRMLMKKDLINIKNTILTEKELVMA